MQTRATIRDTSGHDVALAAPVAPARWRWLALAGAALLVVGAGGLLLRGWAGTELVVARERLRIVPVTEGPFIRDVAAQGTVVAAASPTLFAVAPGTIHYEVRVGDAVAAGQRLATLASPALDNEYRRERATLDGIETALRRQAIEIRRLTLQSAGQEQLADLQVRAAERELQRATAAWERGAIAERDLRRAADEHDRALLQHGQARDGALLERDSLELDLRARRLERDRQALLVADLRARVAQLELHSPVAGVIAALAVPERTTVAAGAALLTVVDQSLFEFEFQVADLYARDIRPAMPATITLDGAPHPGTVTAISPEVRQGLVTGRVRFAGAQPAGLRQSQRGSVQIVLDQRDQARKFARGPDIEPAARQLYRVAGDRALLVPVELGAVSVAEVEVRGGLACGDQVIVAGAGDLNEVPEFRIGD